MEQALNAHDKRTRLLNYFSTADDAKVEAMYTLLDLDVEADENEMSEVEWKEMMRDRERFFSGELQGTPWRETLAAAREHKPIAA